MHHRKTSHSDLLWRFKNHCNNFHLACSRSESLVLFRKRIIFLRNNTAERAISSQHGIQSLRPIVLQPCAPEGRPTENKIMPDQEAEHNPDGRNIASNGNGNGPRRKNGTGSFDPSMFRRLRQEFSEQRRRQRDSDGSCLPRNSAGLPSGVVASDASMLAKRNGPFPAGAATETKHMPEKVSARQELLRLGQRYASSKRTARDIGKQNTQAQRALLSCPDVDNAEITENRERSKSRIALVTPDKTVVSKEAAAVYGSHYLLLARTNSSPDTELHAHHQGNGPNAIDTDDGASSASSNTPTQGHGENENGEDRDDAEVQIDHFLSLCQAQMLISEMEQSTQRQQHVVATACPVEPGSQNENRLQLPKVNLRRILVAIAATALFLCWRNITDVHFSQIHHLFYPPSRSWHPSTLVRSWSFEQVRRNMHLKVGDGVRQIPSLHNNTASVLLSWAQVLRGRTVTYADWVSSSIIRNIHHFEKMYGDAWQLFYFAKFRMSSLIIRNMYHFEKMHGDARRLFYLAKFRVSEVQNLSMVAWNTTLSLAMSCWQHSHSVPMSHLFVKSTERVLIRKATVTTSVLRILKTAKNETLPSMGDSNGVESTTQSLSPHFWKENTGESTFETPKNETLPSMGDSKGVESTNQSLSPQAWRKDTGGSTFKIPKNETLPSMGDSKGVKSTNQSLSPQFWRKDRGGSTFFARWQMHSIPLVRTKPEDRDFSTTHGRILISPALNGLQYSHERSKDLFPVVGLRRYRRFFISHRLDNSGASPYIVKKIAALMIIRTFRRRQNAQLPRHQPLQKMAMPRGTKYYFSSYPRHEQESSEIDVFDDVDMMGLARELAGRFLQHRWRAPGRGTRPRKKWRVKI